MDDNIFSKIAKQMNKYGDSFAKHSEKALQSAISSSEKLANKGLILRKMKQYKISNALRLTIGKEQENEYFIQSIGKILKE